MLVTLNAPSALIKSHV
jgi:hypothetical protein